MRREARQAREVTIHQIDGYHGGDGQYTGPMIFASDRPEKANDDYTLAKDGSLPAVYGIEWETEAKGVTSETIYANLLKEVVFQYFHRDLWKVEHDASLGQGHCCGNRIMDVGAECITQPMTKAYIRNQYRNFRAMWEMAGRFGIDCTRSGNCGQHVHISLTCFGRSKATQDEAIRKLYYIVNRHFRLICTLLYRDPNHTYWCGPMPADVAWSMNLEAMSGSHQNGFNGSHYRHGNIELRIPGGQKNYPCFRNTMESIFHLVETSKNISRKDCDDVTKIFAGCNQHVYDRLRSYCRQAGTITDPQLEIIRATVKPVDFT